MKHRHTAAIVRATIVAAVSATLALSSATPAAAVPGALRLDTASGVLDSGTRLTLAEHQCAAAETTWSVTDSNARVVASGSLAVGIRVLPEGVASEPGVYRLSATCPGWSGSVRFVRSAGPAASADPFFSLNVGASTGDDVKPLSEFAATGAASHREDLQWQAVEKTDGRFDFARIDARVDAWVRRAGSAPLFVLDYGNVAHTGGAMVPPDVSLPKQRAAWERYVSTTVAHMRARYPDADRSYEVWNEWNNFHATRPASADAYVPLAEVTFHAIRAADPDARIVGPGVNAVSAGERAWLLDWFGLGGAQWVDAISIHPYSMPWAPEDSAADGSLERTLAWMRAESQAYPSASGRPAPLWITEIGWPTEGATAVPSGDVGAFLVRAHAIAAVYGVERVYTFELAEPTTGSARAFALFGDADGGHEPRTAAAAYVTMQRQLAGLRFTGVHSEPGVRHVVFSSPDGRRRVRVVWQTVDRFATRQTTVPLRGAASLTDAYGASKAVAGTDGSLTMTATWAPRFVVERG